MADLHSPRPAMTSKGEARRRSIIDAAAAIIRESGPSAVTHRLVAERAGCSLSATTYYFRGLDDLLYEAGRVNISLWSERAEAVAEHVESLSTAPTEDEAVSYLLSATLPAHGPYLGHYIQLISANESVPVGRAYSEGRQRLNDAIERTVAGLALPLSPEIISAVVDGAVVTALSERRDVRGTARALLHRCIQHARQLQGLLSVQEVDRLSRLAAEEHPLPASLGNAPGPQSPS